MILVGKVWVAKVGKIMGKWFTWALFTVVAGERARYSRFQKNAVATKRWKFCRSHGARVEKSCGCSRNFACTHVTAIAGAVIPHNELCGVRGAGTVI